MGYEAYSSESVKNDLPLVTQASFTLSINAKNPSVSVEILSYRPFYIVGEVRTRPRRGVVLELLLFLNLG